MRNYILITLMLALALNLAACGEEERVAEPQQQITMSAEATMATKDENATEATVGEEAQVEKPTAQKPVVQSGIFCLTYEGVTITPNEAFDASALPEALSLYTVPSCALEGTDNVYNYGAFEVTAYNEGNGEFVYSIYFIDPNMTTDEGLALGDDLNRVLELYGDGYTEESGTYVYTKSGTQLRLIVENDSVVSIEYRMAS